jgi:hypothetical protein
MIIIGGARVALHIFDERRCVMSFWKQDPSNDDGQPDITPIISKEELAELGDGEVAYIREMTSDEATEKFPTIDGLPQGINLFALHAADGRPIALTDDRDAAIEHAIGDELVSATVH